MGPKAARPRVKQWISREESESEGELSESSAGGDDDYEYRNTARVKPIAARQAVNSARTSRSRSVRSSGNLGTPSDLYPSSPSTVASGVLSTVASTVTSPLLTLDAKLKSPFSNLTVAGRKSFIRSAIAFVDASTVNRKAWWPVDCRFVDPALLTKEEQSSVCEAMVRTIPLPDLERFAMLSCSLLTKDALPIVQEVLRSARESKQLQYTPVSPVSPVAVKVEEAPLPIKVVMKRSRSTASLDSATPPLSKSMRLSPSLIPLPSTASPLSLYGADSVVESVDSGIEISLLQAEEKITSRGRQFQLRPGSVPAGPSRALPTEREASALSNRRRQDQLQRQLQNQSVGRHRQFSHHPLTIATKPLRSLAVVPPQPLFVDNSLGLATMDNDVYSSTSDSPIQPFPPHPWEDAFQYTAPLPPGSFVTPSVASANYDNFLPGQFAIDDSLEIPLHTTPDAFLGWLEN